MLPESHSGRSHTITGIGHELQDTYALMLMLIHVYINTGVELYVDDLHIIVVSRLKRSLFVACKLLAHILATPPAS